MESKLIRIDPSRTTGRIKPLHGVGSGPVTGNFTHDATEYFRAAGIPFGRTHDIEYPFGSGEFVDIHCVFPTFDADENDPASYNFVMTDEYLRLMREAGTEPFYRLGESIEHQPIKRHIFPPKDFGKWARVCSHIVAHYNEGWANSYEWNIRYWEIWGEPDIPMLWAGTREEFCELFRQTFLLLRREHPAIKIGGPGMTSPGSAMFEPFLAYIQSQALPVDFISWHGYCHTPGQAVKLAAHARELMDRYGLVNAESIYDEWNYVVDWKDLQPSLDLHGTPFGAAFMAALIASMQAAPVDKLMFYDAQVKMKSWNNLFVPKPMKAHAARRGVDILPGYWALYGWNELYKAGDEIACSAPEDLYCAAAKAPDGATLIYIAYYNDDAGLNALPPAPARIAIEAAGNAAKRMTVRRVDDGHLGEEETLAGGEFVMQGNSFALVTIVN